MHILLISLLSLSVSALPRGYDRSHFEVNTQYGRTNQYAPPGKGHVVESPGPVEGVDGLDEGSPQGDVHDLGPLRRTPQGGFVGGPVIAERAPGLGGLVHDLKVRP